MNTTTNTDADDLAAPITFDAKADKAAAIREKFIDVLTPGFQAEFAPDEADQAGAFVEDALSEDEAAASGIDLDAVPVLTVEV